MLNVRCELEHDVSGVFGVLQVKLVQIRFKRCRRRNVLDTKSLIALTLQSVLNLLLK